MPQLIEQLPSPGNNNPNTNPPSSLQAKVLAMYIGAVAGLTAVTGITLGFQTDDKRASPPITPEDLSDKYNARLIANYKSSLGIKFDVYAGTQNGDESALNQAFIFNPRILEFSLRKIDSHIHDAPDNPAKRSIIKNLADIKAGKSKKTIHLVIDTSTQTGCVGDDYRFVKYNRSSCPFRGLAIADNATTSISLIGTGQKTPASTSYSSPTSKLSDQHQTIAHEITHNLSSDRGKPNTFKEGDHDHEVTSWLMGDQYERNFDGKGATNYSPRLDSLIEELVDYGLLPPILKTVSKD